MSPDVEVVVGKLSRWMSRLGREASNCLKEADKMRRQVNEADSRLSASPVDLDNYGNDDYELAGQGGK